MDVNIMKKISLMNKVIILKQFLLLLIFLSYIIAFLLHENNNDINDFFNVLPNRSSKIRISILVLILLAKYMTKIFQFLNHLV